MSYKCAHFLQLITVPQGRSEQCKQLARILQYNQSAAWPLVDVVQVACAAMGLTTSTWLYVYVCVCLRVFVNYTYHSQRDSNRHVRTKTAPLVPDTLGGCQITCAPPTQHIPRHHWVRSVATANLPSAWCHIVLHIRVAQDARQTTQPIRSPCFSHHQSPSASAVRVQVVVYCTHTYTRTHSYQCCQTQSFKIG